MMGFNPTSCSLDKYIAKVNELYTLPCFHPSTIQLSIGVHFIFTIVCHK